MKIERSIFSGLVAAVYFISNVVVLHAAETNFWNERRVQAKRYSSSSLLCQLPPVRAVGLSPSSIDSAARESTQPKSFSGEISRADLAVARTSIAPDGSTGWLESVISPFGNVRDVHVSAHSDRPLIIHIQDIHGNIEAQKNIAHMIGALSVARGVTLVGLEGASGPFDLNDLRLFPDADIKEQATNWAINKDLIGGAEKIGITSEKPLTLWGIEDNALYKANISAVKGSLAKKTEALLFLREFNSTLDRIKTALYSPDLLAYDANLRAYQEGRLGLAEYLTRLTALDSRKSSLHARFPNTALLLDAFGLEAKMDFKEVERQRTDMVDQLAPRLNETALHSLVDKSLAYRTGRLTYSRYYAYVKSLCKAAKIDLARFPALMDYIAYVGMSDRINRDRLFTELTDLDTTVAAQLARTDGEKDVLALSRDSILLGELANNTMTPETWAQYQTRRYFVREIVARAAVLAKASGVDFRIGPPKSFDELLSPFEDFCRLALERNAELTDRLWKKMDDSKSKAAILVAGGFHTEGLSERIKQKGGSYVVLTPRVETIENKNNYLDAFAHDPLPLEKLFDGEKIGILTERGLSQSSQHAVGNASVAQKIEVAMVLQAIQRVFAKMNSEGATLEVIEGKVRETVVELQSAVNLIEELSPRVKAVTSDGATLAFFVDGKTYSGQTRNDRISVTTLERPMYSRFQGSRLGTFFNKNAPFLSKAITAIFTAPFDEAPLTTNKTLGMFIGIHPWKGIDFFIGFQLVRVMALMTFAPAMALFYLAVTGDDYVGVKWLFAFVGVVALFRNNHYYVLSHSVTNVFVFAVNLVLEVADFIAKKFGKEVVYRVPYLTSSPTDNSEETVNKFNYSERNQSPKFTYAGPIQLDLMNGARALFSAIEGQGQLRDVDWKQVLKDVDVLRRASRRKEPVSPESREGDFSSDSLLENNISWLLSHNESQLKNLGDKLELMVKFQKALEFQERALQNETFSAQNFSSLSRNYRELWEYLESTPSPYTMIPNPGPNPRDLLLQSKMTLLPKADVDRFISSRQSVEEYIKKETPLMYGSWGLWNYFGLRNLPLNGFLETTLLDSVALFALTILFPTSLLSFSSDVLNLFGADAILMWFVLSSGVFFGTFFVSYCIHLATGVQQPGGRDKNRESPTKFWTNAREAWGATVTASRGQMVASVAIVAGVILYSPWVAGLGILWAAGRHAYKNYTIELPTLHARGIAEGVKVVSYPMTEAGERSAQDSRASLTDFLRTLFLGAPAGPRLMPVETAVYALQVSSLDSAMAAKAVLGPDDDSLLQSDPPGWVAQKALAYIDQNTTKESMAWQMAFLNLVVQAYHRGGPDSPVVIEMPSPSQWREDPAASMGVAAALTAYGMGNRLLTLVAKETVQSGESWGSEEAMASAAMDAQIQFAPNRAASIAQRFRRGEMSATLVSGRLINAQGQFLLAGIMERAFGADALKQQPFVLGNKSSFDSQGTENPIFFDIVLFARELIKNVQKQSLFLIAA